MKTKGVSDVESTSRGYWVARGSGVIPAVSRREPSEQRPDNLPATYAKYAQLVNERLRQLLPNAAEDSPLADAMRYTPMLGGKRLRPLLVCVAAEAGGESGESVLDAACGTELTHSASLIFDDLPCMDDASERRWSRAAHLVYGEANAILAALSLVAKGFELIARNARALRTHPEVASAVVQRTSEAIQEVAAGQALDLEFQTGRIASQQLLETCYRKKTGGVLALSLSIGAQLARAPRDWVEGLECFGYDLGVAFQLVDDLLDFQSNQEFSGKSAPGSQQQTYATVCGFEPTVRRASEVADSARARLGPLGAAGSSLAALVDGAIRDRLTRIRQVASDATLLVPSAE